MVPTKNCLLPSARMRSLATAATVLQHSLKEVQGVCRFIHAVQSRAGWDPLFWSDKTCWFQRRWGLHRHILRNRFYDTFIRWSRRQHNWCRDQGSSIQRQTFVRGGIYKVIFKVLLFSHTIHYFLLDKWKEKKKMAKGKFLLVPIDAKYLFSFHLTLINL